jgi:pimeloyl-ACP methyl ester carboxylesterase
MAPAAIDEGVVAGPGGRWIGFAVYGDPAGRPVVFCHGGPGSRRSLLGSPALLADAGVRLVSIDRPGSGLSDHRPDARLVDWPDDVDPVVRGLDIERYAVAGVSAGSAYALACGARRPDAVEEVAVIAGVLPPSWYPDDELVALAADDPDAARAEVRRHLEGFAADIDAAVDAMGALPDPDGAVYRRPDVREQFLATYREAFRSGIEGAVHEVLLGNLPWGFELADVAVPVRWWQGSLDRHAPAETVERALAGLAHHTVTVLEGEGHTVGITHAEAILDSLGSPV